MMAGDSTKFNTGWHKGVIAWIEKKLGRNLTWAICQIHTNELSLQALITKLDGKTDSKFGFSGPLGKATEESKGYGEKL